MSENNHFFVFLFISIFVADVKVLLLFTSASKDLIVWKIH